MPLIVIFGSLFAFMNLGLITHKPAKGYSAGGWPSCTVKSYDSQAQAKSAQECVKSEAWQREAGLVSK